MKSAFTLALLAAATAAFSQSPLEEFENLICHEQHAAGALQLDGATSNATDNYDLVYQRCHWQIDPAVHYIRGVVTAYVVPKANAIPSIEFDLSSALTVDSVVYHGQSVGFVHQPDDVLAIPVAGLSAGVLDSVSIFYQGVPAQTGGFGSFNTGIHGPDSIPVLWTLSEPYGARDWWPTKQDLIDKIDSIDVFVTTPSGYQVASNGLRQSVAPSGSAGTHHWKHRYPIAAYLVAIAVTNYAIYTDNVPLAPGDTLPVVNYVYPENLEVAQAGTGYIAQIIGFFNQKAGLYPFAAEKYGHAQFNWGGGMEHQTMTFVVHFGYDLLAHECAHQWFGDKITCGSWSHIWLNEGFATYFQGLTTEAYGFPGNWQLWKQQRLNSVTSQPGGSVYVPDTSDVFRVFSGRLSYNKGAYLLHMLRWRLGDSTFFVAIRNYADDPALRYDYALTRDLQEHLEAASGEDLDEFFNDWFYGEGYPSYHVTWTQQSDQTVLIALDQVTSMPASVGFFENPVPLRLIGVNGETSDVVIDHTFNGQLTEFAPPFAVDTVVIDPDLWLISAGNTVEYDETISTAAPAAALGLHVFPNPFGDVLTVQGTDGFAGGRLRVLDARGAVVHERWLEAPATATWQRQLDLAGVPGGLYWLQVEAGGQAAAVRLVKR
jgi:hypothetical protein